jgi:hypothetical protein
MFILFLLTFNPFYFIHYSDPQIGRNAYTVPYCSLAIAQISAMSPLPRFVIVCGDMANNPENQTLVQQQWHTCDSLFDLLPVSVGKYYAPGNNDVGYEDEGCWTPGQLLLYRGFWGPDYYSFDNNSADSCHFIALNSTLLDTYSGHACYDPYSLEQDSFLRADLATVAGSLQKYKHLFFFHHFPLYVSSPGEGNSHSSVDRPRRDTLLLDLVDYDFSAVFAGHLHGDLQFLYGPSLLQTGLATCETNIGLCGYRVVKVFSNGIETFTVWLQSPLDTVPMVNIVSASVDPETLQAGETAYFNCLVDSFNFPDWRSLSYAWDFGDSSASGQANTTHIYADTGHYRVVFRAYNNPRLCAQYKFDIVVRSTQIAENEAQTAVRDLNSVIRIYSSSIIRPNSHLSFELHSSVHSLSAVLYSADGRCVTDLEPFGSNKCVQNLSMPAGLAPGIYFLLFKYQTIENHGSSSPQQAVFKLIIL